jgi:hypothetical protein
MADLSVRTFKRGDWVKWDHGNPECIHRHCLFIKNVLAQPLLASIDDNGHNFTVAVDQLQPDEAPE